MANRAWVYAKIPAPEPVAADIFELKDVELPKVEDGMFMAKLVAIAVMPHIRAFLNLPGNDVGAETIGLSRTKIGETILCEIVAEVVETKCKGYKVGDRIVGFLPLQQYQVFREDGKDRIDGQAPQKAFKGMDPIETLGISSNVTAYLVANRHPCGRVEEPGCGSCFGFLRPKAKKTVLVTSAAGAVGTVAGQLYKNKGCKVIGVTGTRSKADRVKEFGFDDVIAYKEEDLDKRLGELVPEGIDVFFDNVGSTQLDIGTKHMKSGGKIVQVGCQSEIDNYATGNITGWKNYHYVAGRELQVGGFLLTNHLKKIPGAAIALMIMSKMGKMKSAETIVHGKLEDVAGCIDRLRTGDTFGRVILKLDDTGA